jgi:dTDP-4-dehydrorhamnose reductase
MDRAFMKIVVTGSQGMLGTDMVQMLSRQHDVIGWDVHNCNILDAEQVERMTALYRPDVIIHTAAYTNVDLAESEPEAAMQLNVEGTRNLARAARPYGSRLLYISTDYVFDGTANEPYQEDQPPCPAGVYGKTKLQGEHIVQELLEPQAWSIVRIAWLYGKHGENFVSTMLNLAKEHDTLRVVHDQTGSPTYTKDVVRGIEALLAHQAAGIFHLTNSGTCSWYDLTQTIMDFAGISGITIQPITAAEFGRPAPRPAYSVLDTAKFTNATGQRPRHWKKGLREYLEEIGVL